MFEIPEYTTLARQMNETLAGKTIQRGTLGNSPHKFVWYNRTHEEFENLTRDKRVGVARVRGRWLTLDLEPGYRLFLGECGQWRRCSTWAGHVISARSAKHKVTLQA